MKKMVKETKVAAATNEQPKNDASPAKAKRPMPSATKMKLSESMKANWAKRRGANPEQDNSLPVQVQTLATPIEGQEPPAGSAINENPMPESKEADLELGRAEAPLIAVGETASSPAGGRARPQPAAKTSVPFMITEAAQAKLRDLGLFQETIDKMTPQEAHAILEAKFGMTSKEAKVTHNLAIDAGVSTPEGKVAGVGDDRARQAIPAKPCSPKKQASNARNSKLHSTGPKTPAGKRRSSMNALKHGTYARHLFATAAQWLKDGQDYRIRAAAIRDYFRPRNALVELLVEKLAVDMTHLARFSLTNKQPSPQIILSMGLGWTGSYGTRQRQKEQ